ncbi:hypothetical protein BX661DRAFT_188774 [Kickxella alabastrina]|uniref:uncharacterized protein n=1 Tax=Kickxella alabastrina TaxID=61397 RepID=UPI00222107B2|nr:uncharacterized protein BX661DRAFT_188774 [Kickxella alabastrina]KAI7820907.1 hypothetical protein BX661DRAFT_188774 [Kickxella alabastrina]
MTNASTDSQPEYIVVSPILRLLNHAFAGITETPRIAVRPTKLWLKRTTTVVLLGIAAGTLWYRRLQLQRVNGLVSLAGASRPVLSGIVWTAGIAGALNARPLKMESDDA